MCHEFRMSKVEDYIFFLAFESTEDLTRYGQVETHKNKS